MVQSRGDGEFIARLVCTINHGQRDNYVTVAYNPTRTFSINSHHTYQCLGNSTHGLHDDAKVILLVSSGYHSPP